MNFEDLALWSRFMNFAREFTYIKIMKSQSTLASSIPEAGDFAISLIRTELRRTYRAFSDTAKKMCKFQYPEFDKFYSDWDTPTD